MERHYRRLENLYHGANCNRYYAPRLHVEDGRAEVRIPIREEFWHAAHAVHGSLYFKALDDATFFAVNSRVPDVFVLTGSFQVDLLAPVAEGELRAVAEVQEDEGRWMTASGVLYSGDTVVARGRGRFARSRIPLDERVGYAD